MGSKTKKIKSSGRFSGGIGTKAKGRFNVIIEDQKKKHASPFHPTGKAKRIAAGIWKCQKTGKIFAGPAYSLTPRK